MTKLLFATGLAALCMSLLLACSSSSPPRTEFNFDYTYFERQQAAREAAQAKVMTQGLWANEDGSGRRFGVILPRGRNLRSAGESVMSGVLAGYWADNPDGRARVTIYTEEQYGTIEGAYREAVTDGAEVVIGPLPKESVRRLVDTTPLGKPTIALNTTGGGARGQQNLFQFSLSIDEEAVNAARVLYASGYRKAFLLYEDNAVGDRGMRAFSAEMLRLGGGVPVTVQFSTRDYGYEVAAERIANATFRVKLLSLNPKEQRYAVYRSADAVFVAGERDGIAGMVWGLRNAGINDLPIVTTSNANVRDRGVDGVYAVDLPWLIDAQMRSQIWARTAPGFQGEELRLDPRLFAMGMDSYRLAQNIEWMNANRERTMDGVTGLLSISRTGRVDRVMMLGKIDGGRAREAQLPAFNERDRRPIHEILVREGKESVVPVSDATVRAPLWRNPFGSVRF